YSDVTALLLWQRRCAGLMGFHGPMLDRGDDVAADALASLVAQLGGRGRPVAAFAGQGHGGGRATGRLAGGSLTMIAASIGTPWEIDTRRVILMLEDTGERPYRIDRMLQQLSGAGKLAQVAGVGLGDFESCVDDRFPDRPVLAVILEVLRPLGVPVVTGLSFGHVRANYPWPEGARATIDGDSGELRVIEQGVESPS
ncbi:MAG: LD-carboxypeptidase, partial [Gaiellales bacterium]